MVGLAAGFPWHQRVGREVLSATLTVPAKAMLFGEYGVLYGGPALVATLAEPCFVFQMRLEEIAKKAAVHSPLPVVTFESEMVGLPVSFDGQGRAVTDFENQGPVAFLSRIFGSLNQELRLIESAGLCLRICIDRAYAPDLGLGSSSAVIAGIVALVMQATSAVSRQHGAHQGTDPGKASGVPGALRLQGFGSLNQSTWGLLRGALHAAQGRGSGYDVAVQFLAAQWSTVLSPELNTSLLRELDQGPQPEPEIPPKGRLWTFWPSQRNASLPPEPADAFPIQPPGGVQVPQVDQWTDHPFWLHAGWLLPSGQAAATQEILRKPNTNEPLYAQEHAGLAVRAWHRVNKQSDWLATGGPHPFADLFDEALELAQAQGIAHHLGTYSELAQLRNLMAYKTMGAGHGDSVWAVSRVLRGSQTLDPPLPNGGRSVIALSSKKDPCCESIP